MVRLGKLTDYGLVLMTCIARSDAASLRTARDLAQESHLPLSTVSKLLKELLHCGLLVSHRGIKGGYILARDSRETFIQQRTAAMRAASRLQTSALCIREAQTAHRHPRERK